VDASEATAAAASTYPLPHREVEHPDVPVNAREVDCRAVRIWVGVSDGSSDSSSAAVAATCGAAIDVPLSER
jgi:hypothetical protein